jgi:hypothetical protein
MVTVHHIKNNLNKDPRCKPRDIIKLENCFILKTLGFQTFLGWCPRQAAGNCKLKVTTQPVIATEAAQGMGQRRPPHYFLFP